MVGESEQEINHRDFTTVLKDGMLKVVLRPQKDGSIEPSYEVNSKSAWWKTHFINSYSFGMMGEYLEDFGSFKETVKYHMSKPMADVIGHQIDLVYETLRCAIDAKSSETMRNDRNAQTALGDKYLANKQERIVDIKNEISKSLSDSIMGKEAHDSTR